MVGAVAPAGRRGGEEKGGGAFSRNEAPASQHPLIPLATVRAPLATVGPAVATEFATLRHRRPPEIPIRTAAELVEFLRAQVEDLRTDRDAWREQARRSDYLHGLSMERTRELEGRLRELEAPADTEARESPESPTPTRTPTDTAGAPETATEQRPRSLWRRIFGGS